MKRGLLVLCATLGSGCLLLAQNQALSLTPPGPPFDYLLVNDPASLVPPTGITIESWIYPVGAFTPGVARAIVLRDDGGNGPYSLYFYLSGSHPGFHFRTPMGVQGILATDTVPSSQWTHLAATFDNSMARMYKNGLLIAEAAATGPLLDIVSPYLAIGTFDLWNGQLDEVRIWSRARSAEEIQAGKSYQLEDEWGLIASWHFDGDYLDSTGNHHATPSGVPLFVPSTAPLLPSLSGPRQVQPGAQLVYRVSAVTAPVTYVLDISITGTSPGIPLPAPLSGTFPLNPPLLFGSLFPAYPASFHDFSGTTGPGGYAFPAVDVPADPMLAGIPVSAAFATLDAAGPFGIGTISNGVTTGIAAQAPQVAQIAPATAPTEGGTAVTITGANFLQGVTVYFGASAAATTAVTPSSIECIVPPGPLGPTPVAVVNPEFSEVVAGTFSYVPTLVISGVAPQFGTPGSQVVVTGSGFQQGLTLTVDGQPVSLVSVTPSAATFLRPASVACNSTLLVTNPDGQMKSIGFNTSADLDDIVPGFGLAAGGNPAFLIGTGFVAGTSVTVGGQPATVTSISPTSVLFIVPGGAPGFAPVIVTLPSGCTSMMEYLYQ